MTEHYYVLPSAAYLVKILW